MSRRKILSSLPVVALAAAALSAPAAPAMPKDPTGPPPADVHRPGDERTLPSARTPRIPAPADLHGRAQAQVANKDGTGDIDVPAALIVAGTTLLVGGGMAATAMRHRTRTAV